MSYFNRHAVASGYARYRPFFHPEVVERVASTLSIDDKVGRALDVGCGAGLSTIALTEIAKWVVGVDSSSSMIRSAIEYDGVTYCSCAAESLPFNCEFELITLSGAINWIHRPSFFKEARRHLKAGCFVVVYDNTNQGIMDDDVGFSQWHENSFLEEYPTPPRDESPISRDEALGYGFEFTSSEDYTNEVRFTMDGYVDYLLTQSNVAVAMASGKKESCMRAALRTSLAPFFQEQEKTLKFGGYIWYLWKV